MVPLVLLIVGATLVAADPAGTAAEPPRRKTEVSIHGYGVGDPRRILRRSLPRAIAPDTALPAVHRFALQDPTSPIHPERLLLPVF